jgi:hypothetical protein
MLAGKWTPAICENCDVKVYPKPLLLGILGGSLHLLLIVFLFGALYYQSWLILILFLFLFVGIFILVGLYSPLSYKEPNT